MKHFILAFFITILAGVQWGGVTAYAATPRSADAASSAPAVEIHIKLPGEDTLTSASFVKAYTIETKEQLTAGNLADAFLGDLVLENDLFKAVIARPDKNDVGIVRGGTLMDVVPAAAPVDYFGGLNTTVDPVTTGSAVLYTEAEPAQVQSGTTAVLTLKGYVGNEGQPAPSISNKIGVKTRYTVAKGSPVIRIDTNFENETTRTAWLQPADMIDWGEATVFSEGFGFQSTTAPVSFIVGTADDFALGYYTSGTKHMEGYHHGRDSIVLASGAIKTLEASLAARRQAEKVDRRIPEQYRASGASFTKEPGMIVYPGTETRYIAGSGGMPVNQPLFVPAANVSTIDGVATVTVNINERRDVFSKPASKYEPSFIKLDPGKTFSFTRYLQVADGNWGGIANRAFAEKGQSRTEMAGVVVEIPSGKTLAGADVRVSGGPGWDGTGQAPAVLQTKTNSDGAYRILLPEGKYRLEPAKVGRRPVGKIPTVDLKSGEKMNLTVLQMTRESLLRMAISEAETPTSSPLPVKITLISKPPYPTVNYGFSPDVSQGIRNTFYMPQGAAVFPVTPGRYRLVVSRGLEYDILQKDIAVSPGQELTVVGSLRHVMMGALPGMVSMDAGIVTDASAVGYATAETRAIQAACEGVSVIISGDYGKATDFSKAIRDQGLGKWVKSFVGRRELLHKGNLTADLLVYPLDKKTSASFDQAIKDEKGLPPDIILADLKKKFPNLIFEISRPMHPEAGYLTPFPFNKSKQEFEQGSTPPPDFDAIQVLEGKKLGLETEVYPRYMAMQLARLSKNDRYDAPPLSPVGGSFSRLPYGQEVGYPRIYLYLDKDKNMSNVTGDDIVSAVRGQHYLLTNGPILFFDAMNFESGRFDIKPGDILDAHTTEIVRIRATVLAAPWVHLQGINTRENGVRGITVLTMHPSKDIYRYPSNPGTGSNVYTRYLKEDTVLDAYAYSTVRSLEPVVPDALSDFGGKTYPYCMSGPIFVDRDGDGKITINNPTP